MQDKKLKIDVEDFAEYLIENASIAFEYQDRELLESVIRNYKDIDRAKEQVRQEQAKLKRQAWFLEKAKRLLEKEGD